MNQQLSLDDHYQLNQYVCWFEYDKQTIFLTDQTVKGEDC